eukprot:sb/3475535/
MWVQNGRVCTGIPRSHTSPKRRRTASRHSEECDRIIFGGTGTGSGTGTLAADMGLIGGSVCQNCHRSADTADKFLPSANQKLAFQSPTTKVRSAIHSYRASTSLENSPDEVKYRNRVRKYWSRIG